MLSIQIYDNPDDMTSKMLDRGPDYFRRRVLKTDPVLSRQHRKSAVELLEESKALYVKSESVREQRQLPKNAENLQLGARRSRIVDEGGRSKPPPLPPRRKSVPQCSRRPTPPKAAPPTPPGPHPTPPAPDGSRMTTAKPINLPPAEDAAPINSQPAPAAAAASVARLQPPSHSSSQGKLHYNGMDAAKDKPSAKLTSGSKSENTSPATRRDKVHGLMSADEWREACTDTSSDVDRASGSSLPKLDDHALAMVKRRVKKAINRSRSDLTKRLSNSSDLSELSARFSRNSADLEKFFNEMGLDKSVLAPMLSAHCASDLNLFESVSSLDSPDIRSLSSDDSTQKSEHGLKTAELHVGERTAGQTSIVERNARIIKWLCNVKKATSQEED